MAIPSAERRLAQSGHSYQQAAVIVGQLPFLSELGISHRGAFG